MAAFRNIFQSIPLRKPKRNIFDLSYDSLLTLNFGELVPVLCKEVLPGDTWQVQSSTMVRFAPMLAPIMHRCNVYIHYFFVPNRILWSDWEDFITGGKDGTANPTLPYIVTSALDDLDSATFNKLFGERSLWDYFNLPTRAADEAQHSAAALGNFFDSGGRISALPFAAYTKIWNDYYRDQNLQDEIDVKDFMDSGFLDPTDSEDDRDFMIVRKRAWEKDYFTSALPWPQRGGDVHLPMTGDADVKYRSTYKDSEHIGTHQLLRDYTGEQVDLDGSAKSIGAYPTAVSDPATNSIGIPSNHPADIDPNGTLYADLSNVNSATVNELRRAMRLQEWLEKNARAGYRYIEQILSHFGVRSSDGRLDRAEYLGGGKCPVGISEVLQTSETTNNSPLADMAGHGLAVGNSNKFRKFFEEHGYVMGIMSIVPRSSYGNGIPKQFTKNDKFDFAWPEFANLGEQEIKGYELNLTGNTSYDNGVFGYTPRYADYKFSLNEFHGDFRSNMAFWHLGRMFPDDEFPSLNADFITVGSDIDNLNRIFAVQDSGAAHLWVECYNRITVARTLPKFGVPTL